METLYALVKDNVVQNVIVADAAFAKVIKPEWQAVVLLTNANGTNTPCGIGWGWNGKIFTAPVAPK